jgi:hypothetical protein
MNDVSSGENFAAFCAADRFDSTIRGVYHNSVRSVITMADFDIRVPWTVLSHRLAIGIEPIDAVLGTRLARAVEIDIERTGSPLASQHDGFMRLARRARAPVDLESVIRLRIQDRRRGWIPRRIEVPLAATTEVATVPRIRRPVLFPGIAWDSWDGATALRCRVRRGGAAVRWAWIEVRRIDEDGVVLRTRADEHGEFLLVPGLSTLARAELDGAFELDVEAFGPSGSGEVDPDDPLADLPIERLTLDAAGEARSAGEGDLPTGWASLGRARVILVHGQRAGEPTSLEF